jgi:hypothetical protein
MFMHLKSEIPQGMASGCRENKKMKTYKQFETRDWPV